MKKFHSIKNKERGQSLVELALTITFLMALLAGTIDLGRAFFTWLALRDAAQEGAAYGSIAPPSAGVHTCDSTTIAPIPEICKRIWANLGNNVIRNAQSVVVIRYTIDQPCLGHTVQIDLNYPTFPLTTPFLGTLLGSQVIPIHATINDTVLRPMCN